MRARLTYQSKVVTFLIADTGDRIGAHIARTRRFYEEDLLSDAQSRYRGGDIVDVGAHIGNHTVFFAKIIGAHVHSFEPNKPVYRQLIHNLKANVLQKQVTAYPWALGKDSGKATVYMPENATNTGMAKVAYGEGECPVVRLDDVLDPERKVGIIKIDVEGAELEVLYGASKTIERWHPLLYVEVGDDVKRYVKIRNFLKKFGYAEFGDFAVTRTVGFRYQTEIKLSATIMAHPSRSTFVDELSAQLDIGVVWDEKNNRWDTGRRSLLAATDSTHHLVIQDDAVAPDNLVATLTSALTYVPDGTPLALYLGAVARYRNTWLKAVRPDTSWITMPGLNWGVGLVIPTGDIEELVAECDRMHGIANYDLRLSRFYEQRKIYTWYPWPSLVDHRDSPSLVAGRTGKRHAWRYVGDKTFDPAGGVVTANIRR